MAQRRPSNPAKAIRDRGGEAGFGPSVREGRTARAIAAAASAKTRAAARTRRTGRPLRRKSGCRWEMSSQRSGAGIRSTPRNRVLRSGIVIPQQLSEPSAAPGEVHADGGWGGSDDLGHLLQRVPAVVVQDHRRSLFGREAWEGNEQRDGLLREFEALVDPTLASSPSPLQFAGGDAKGGTPYPKVCGLDGGTPVKRLGESLGHSVARHLSVSRVQEQGSPHPFSLLAVYVLQIVPHIPPRRSRSHAIRTGGGLAQVLNNARSPASSFFGPARTNSSRSGGEALWRS